MFFKQIISNPGQNFSYILADERTKEAAVIDPSYETEWLIKIIESEKLKVKYIINTHDHHDHTAGNSRIKEKTGAKIIAHKFAKVGQDVSVDDKDEIKIGNLKMKVIYTPGHCKSSICLTVENKILTGDTLFVGECGRTDLAGSDPAEMYDSLFNKLMKLNDETEVYPGHDYGGKPFSTIGFERKNNYVLKTRTKEEFVEFMKS